MAFTCKREKRKGELVWQKSYIRKKYMSVEKTVWMNSENTIDILKSTYAFQKLASHGRSTLLIWLSMTKNLNIV